MGEIGDLMERSISYVAQCYRSGQDFYYGRLNTQGDPNEHFQSFPN